MQAERGDPTAARQALQVLQATGNSQPEIESDLQRTPPDLPDAEARLGALSSALKEPARTPNPARARSEVSRILALPRYAAMNSKTTIVDRILDAIGRELLKAFSQLSFGALPSTWVWIAVVVLLLVVTGVVVWLLQAGWGRGRGGVVTGLPPTMRQQAIDRFALADRLARGGDYLGAIRALTGGVAASLGGEGAWEVSPLTVRELFSRAPRPEELRPLLVAFEAAAYGGRVPSEEQYHQAEAVALAYRPGPAEAAA